MPDKEDNPVREHNRFAAAMWSAGGRYYDEVSFAISDALAHAAQRLAPRPGSSVLDIATGTGWTARNAARMGAKVTAIDIADKLLAAAERLSAATEPPITFRRADAEDLPFADASFDGVISTFGVMFAPDQERAAGEMARVCRPGGRLVLATWTSDGAVAKFFQIIAAHSDSPPDDGPSASPLDWGDPDHVADLLGDAFDLTFETGENHAYHEDAEAIWQWYLRGFGPLKMLHEGLDEPARRVLKAEIDRYHDKYRNDAGLRVDREYLVTIGRRK